MVNTLTPGKLRNIETVVFMCSECQCDSCEWTMQLNASAKKKGYESDERMFFKKKGNVKDDRIIIGPSQVIPGVIRFLSALLGTEFELQRLESHLIVFKRV